MEKYITTGVIDKKIYGETGNVMYYVNVYINGKKVRAQSINYSSKTQSLMEGKEVKISLYEISKGNKRCEIIDENIVSCNDELKKSMPYIIAGFAIVFIAIVVSIIIKYNI